MTLDALGFPPETLTIEFAGPETTAAAPSEPVLPELPPSTWRSLGRRFDYRNWEDRDRFVELDHAILARDLRDQEIMEAAAKRRRVQMEDGGISWTGYSSFHSAA